jgi:myo-inositol-1(or 4)-monophosphatase
MSDILAVAIEAARTAGRFIKKKSGNFGKVHSKGDRNLVTDIDRQAERIILKKISARFPGHAILAEESGKNKRQSEYRWIVDPIDGTHNYIRGINVYGVSLGLMRGDDFVLGVIYMPHDDELYTAEKWQGAYKNGKRMKVSGKKDLKGCSFSFDSSIRYKPRVMLPVLGEACRKAFNVRMTGSSVRALSYIAEGKLDFSIEFYDKPWDFAGGVCLIEEAGGKITALDGARVGIENVGYIASNGKVHAQVSRIVNKYL